MHVKVDNDFVYLETPHHLKTLASEQLGGVWSQKHKMYKYPKNSNCLNELINRFPELQHNVVIAQALYKVDDARRTLLALKECKDSYLIHESKLRPYQRVDIYYLQYLKSAGIFNEPRTGKTPTSICLMNTLKTKINLIVCPASLIWNWTNEFKKWDPDIEVYTIAGTPKVREGQIKSFKSSSARRVMVISKDTWKSTYKEFESFKFDTVFVDEAHYLRNHKTVQSKAIFKINSDRKYALTGTPTVKHAMDIWGILHFLYPTKFSSYWNFANRYFEINEDYFGHTEVGGVLPHRKQELQELIGFMSVQRKRSEVMQWLPDKEYITFYVQMNSKQEKYYNQLVEDFIVTDEDDAVLIDTENVLAQLTRMRQICLDPMLVQLNAESAKTEALLEYLEDNQEPVVIMSMFTSYLDKLESLLSSKGYKVGMITGKMSNAEKQSNATRFQNGDIDILLCNIISAGTGFTLDRGETIIFMDKAWNPSDNEQAEDRITPTTKEKNHKHTVISFVCQNTFDESINQLLEQKKSITDIINQGGRKAIQDLLRGKNYEYN